MFEKFQRFDFNRFIKSKQIIPAMESLFVANLTLIFCISILQVVNPVSLFAISQVGVDISILSIGFIWISMIQDPIGMAFIILGWGVAAVFARKKYGNDATSIIFKGSAIPVVLILITLGSIVLSLMASTLGIFLLIPFLMIIGVLFAVSLVLSTGGVLLSQFISFDQSYDFEMAQENNYLVLPIIPDQEAIEHCPFRSSLPGCSYLGYKAPNFPLICDYKSSYLRCRVYAHIYKSIKEAEE